MFSFLFRRIHIDASFIYVLLNNIIDGSELLNLIYFNVLNIRQHPHSIFYTPTQNQSYNYYFSINKVLNTYR